MCRARCSPSPASFATSGTTQLSLLPWITELNRLRADEKSDLEGDEDHSVVGLGRSVRVRANGSVAPVALGPAASVRAVMALRVGRFDVLHLHEPLAPGASYACLALGQPAKVGTFHRSGQSVFYSVLGPLARGLAGRLQVRCAVSAEARSTAERALGGSYQLIGNGVEVERFSRADPWPTRGPTIMFVGRHEKRKGLQVLLDAMSRVDNPRAVFWIASDGPETERLMERYPPSDSLVWLGRIKRRRGSKQAERFADRVLPLTGRRVLRSGPPRSDGSSYCHRRERPSRLQGRRCKAMPLWSLR